MSVQLDTSWPGSHGTALTASTPAIGSAFTFSTGDNDAVLVGNGFVRMGVHNVDSIYLCPSTSNGVLIDVSFGILCLSDLVQDTLISVCLASGQQIQAGIKWGSQAQWSLYAQGPSAPFGSYATFVNVNPAVGRTYICRLIVTPYFSKFYVDGVLVATNSGTDGLGIVPTAPGTLALILSGAPGVTDTTGYQLGRVRYKSANPRPAGRNIPSALNTTLQGEVMSLAMCIKVVRGDGTIFGFTTHDQDITLSGQVYEAMSATQSTNIRQEVGGSPDNLDVTGLLSSDKITETDLRAGLYDNAAITIYLCDWSNPSNGSVILLRGNIGDVSLQDNQYTASVRSIMQRYQQQVGEVCSPTCRVFHLGDSRCKFNLAGTTVDTNNATTTGATVTSIDDPNTIHLSGMVSAVGYYAYGLITSTSGLNSGYSREIKTHSNNNDPDEVLVAPTTATFSNLAYKDPLDFSTSVSPVFNIPAGVWSSASLLLNSSWSLIHTLSPGTDELTVQFPVGGANDVVLRSASGSSQYTDAFQFGSDVVTAINLAAGSTLTAGIRHTAPSHNGAPFFHINVDNIFIQLIGYKAGTSDRLVLHEPFPFPVQVGDTFTVVTGCDRLISTCSAKFNNVVNFRGEPNVPGIDKLMQVGRPPS